MLKNLSVLCIVLVTGLFLSAADEPAKPAQHRFRVTGLFQRNREEDLKAAVAQVEGVKLVAIDFAAGEATFEFDAKQVTNRTKPEQIIERFDQLIKGASNGTFGIRALPTIAREELTKIEIPVVGLDCKGCCWATYQAVYKIDGVEQATASYRDGLVTALIDPAKTNRAALEEALRQKGVKLAGP